MPNPNAVVATTIQVERSAEAADSYVNLDGRRIRLGAADERSAGVVQVLEGLARLNHPVYAEIDPDSESITRLLVPKVGRVLRVDQSGDGLDVSLDTSHARLRVGAGEDGSELAALLRRALDDGQPVILTADDGGAVIDVRELPPDAAGAMRPFRPAPEAAELAVVAVSRWFGLLSWFWRFIRRFWCWWFCCVSPSRAQQIFDAMSATTCDPLSCPAPCIPFKYPDDGCWGRAHEMCRLMIAMGLKPRKVWINASSGAWLHVATRNNPQCYVEWNWHVAPTLCVRAWYPFRVQRMVIDPSLFTTPVSEATWKSVQGDPAATLTQTGPEIFSHGGGTDPTYSGSDAVLAQYRLALLNRSNSVGPPPYANCP